MTAENVSYIDYIEAVGLHFALMKLWGETRFGVDSRDLIESPRHVRSTRQFMKTPTLFAKPRRLCLV